MAEIVKCGFIRDPRILELVEADPAAAQDPGGDLLVELVRRAVAVKARVVAADTREHGERAVLNYGHTFGHALETMTGYTTYRHGEAVGIGMRFAAQVGERTGASEPGLDARTVALLDDLGLPTSCGPVDHDAALAVMARDKKARDGVRLVLCTRPGVTTITHAPSRAVLDAALDAVSAPPTA
jgi:3-dehydroquinate synthase